MQEAVFYFNRSLMVFDTTKYQFSLQLKDYGVQFSI